jgi:hypothetical protein
MWPRVKRNLLVGRRLKAVNLRWLTTAYLGVQLEEVDNINLI